jgi:hypothetical protein
MARRSVMFEDRLRRLPEIASTRVHVVLLCKIPPRGAQQIAERRVIEPVRSGALLPLIQPLNRRTVHDELAVAEFGSAWTRQYAVLNVSEDLELFP